MKKLNNSNFELIENIIKTIDFNYDENANQNLEKLNEYWIEVVGKKISKFSKIHEMMKNGTVIVSCADSIVANELYYEKSNLLKYLVEKTNKTGITIKDIIFDYKKWKDNEHEKEI